MQHTGFMRNAGTNELNRLGKKILITRQVSGAGKWQTTCQSIPFGFINYNYADDNDAEILMSRDQVWQLKLRCCKDECQFFYLSRMHIGVVFLCDFCHTSELWCYVAAAEPSKRPPLQIAFRLFPQSVPVKARREEIQNDATVHWHFQHFENTRWYWYGVQNIRDRTGQATGLLGSLPAATLAWPATRLIWHVVSQPEF